MTSSSQIDVVCLFIPSDIYTVEYVNKLYSSVSNNVASEIKFHCITDETEGFHRDIILHPLVRKDLPGWWMKLSLFSDSLYEGMSDRILFIDLDVIIKGSLDDYFSYNQEASLIGHRDFRHPTIHTSIFRLDRSKYTKIWEEFSRSAEIKNGRALLHGKSFFGDQDVIDWMVGDSVAYYPQDWIASYRWEWLKKKAAEGTKIISFHGLPKPHQLDENDSLKKYWT